MLPPISTPSPFYELVKTLSAFDLFIFSILIVILTFLGKSFIRRIDSIEKQIERNLTLINEIKREFNEKHDILKLINLNLEKIQKIIGIINSKNITSIKQDE